METELGYSEDDLPIPYNNDKETYRTRITFMPQKTKLDSVKSLFV